MEAFPEGCVRESVHDYLTWRRDRGATARALGVSRSTLWRRMRKFGLAEEPFEAKTKEAPSGQHDKRKESP